MDFVVDYAVPVTGSERADLGTRVQKALDAYDSTTERRRQNAYEWRRAARMMPADLPGEDWESNVRAPQTRVACQHHTQRLNAQILQQRPCLIAVPNFGETHEKAQAVQDVLTSYLDAADWTKPARGVHKQLPVACPCAIRVDWDRRVRRVLRHVTEHHPELAAALPEIAGIDPATAYDAAFERDRQGRAKVKLEYENVVDYDGLAFTVIPFHDLVYQPVAARNADELWMVGHRYRARGADLLEGAKNGQYEMAWVKELLGSGFRGSGITDEMEERGDLSGYDWDTMPDLGGREEYYREFNCVSVCWKDDLNGDGEMEWYVIKACLDPMKVLSVSHYPYEHGKPNYVLFSYDPDVADLAGQSIAELNATTQEVADEVINSVVDLTTIMKNMGSSFFYTETSGFDPHKFTLRPGTQVQLESVEGIMPMRVAENVPTAVLHLQNLLMVLETWSEKLTATSNPTLGRETTNQKTLGEVQIVMGQAASIFEDYAAHVATSWAEVWEQARQLIRQYHDGEGFVTFRKQAVPKDFMEDGTTPAVEMPTYDPLSGGVAMQRQPAPQGYVFGRLPAEIMAADVTIVPAGMGNYLDQQFRAQSAYAVLQETKANPVSQMNLPLIAKAFERWLNAINYEGREEYIGMLQQGAQQAMQMMQLQQMLMAMQGGAGPGDPGQGQLPPGKTGQPPPEPPRMGG